MTSQTNYRLYIHGMRCQSCAITTEKRIKALPNVVDACSNYDECCIEIEGDFEGRSAEKVAEELSGYLDDLGYALSTERSGSKKWGEFKIALPLALSFVAVFIFLQKIGLVNLISTEGVNYSTAFVIGIVASLSTCMAVVGGLLLSMSGTFAKEGDRVGPQLYFHVGRLIAFFILGGLIGVLGSAFQLSALGVFVVGILVGLVMLILGLNLLDVFGFSKKLAPRMPKFLSNHALSVTKLNHSLTPFLVGVATFFLPCGFTQAMQIYTLSAGSFVSGALTMFVYALGTLPVLALLSFSSLTIKSRKGSGIFFKTVGLVVVAFAVLNIVNAFTGVGLLPPIFNF
jgi:uncharacterized protein